jgi:hypothetical protein
MCYRRICNGHDTITMQPSCRVKIEFLIMRRLRQLAAQDLDWLGGTGLPHRSEHARQHRSRPAIRRPRVPTGQRLVRERGWLTSDHLDACWYRIVERRSDWSQVRLEVTAEPDDERQR